MYMQTYMNRCTYMNIYIHIYIYIYPPAPRRGCHQAAESTVQSNSYLAELALSIEGSLYQAVVGSIVGPQKIKSPPTLAVPWIPESPCQSGTQAKPLASPRASNMMSKATPSSQNGPQKACPRPSNGRQIVSS